MRLTIVNVSKTIKSSRLKTVVAALNRQVTEHFQPEWFTAARLRAVNSKLANINKPLRGSPEAIIYLGDSSQDDATGVDGAYGYHSTNHADIPYGFVYLDVCAQNREEWSCTLSHEVLELLGDPFAAVAVPGPDPRSARKRVYYDLEICDPTQGDTYVIDRVIVSNFVTRAYFDMSENGGATNFLRLPLKPFGVRRGGYVQFEDGKGAHQIEGMRSKAARARRSKARLLMKNGRRNTRRLNRIK